MKCSCCGEERPDGTVAALMCHPDVKVCRGCVGWLRDQTGTIDVTPTLPVRDMDEAIEFYERAGFDVRVYDGGGYAFVTHDDESVFDLGFEEGFETSSARAGCYLVVPDVDRWHAALTEVGHSVTVVAEQPYGIREFSLRDPSGNTLRFGNRTD